MVLTSSYKLHPCLVAIGPIFSPSMPTLDDFYEPTIEPILDSNESSNALSPKPPNNLRNPSTHPTHRNHLDHKEGWEEQHQWLKSIKNRYAIIIECVDEALYETNVWTVAIPILARWAHLFRREPLRHVFVLAIIASNLSRELRNG